MYLMFFSISAIVFCGYFQYITTQSFPNYEYGPYQIDWSYFRPCKGPKSKNLTFITTSLVKTPENKFITAINITFLSTSQVEEMKVEVYKESARNILLWNYRVKNLCKNFAIGSLLIQQFKTDSRCIIKKGSYYSSFNVSDLANIFLGAQFFYGDFICRVTITAKKGNLSCLTQGISFTKAIDD